MNKKETFKVIKLNSQYRFVHILIYTGVLGYILIRGYALSFTHDESLSYSILQGNSYLRGTANNHLLNTLLMSVCEFLFGPSEFSLRLPNMLSFLTYATGCFFIFKTPEKLWLSILGLSIALFNPYFLEFFSLARGYGLSMGFMMMSMYFLIRNEIKYVNKTSLLSDFGIATLFAALAAYSSLVLINYFICVMLIFGIKYWFSREGIGWDRRFRICFWAIFLVSWILIFFGIARLVELKEGNELYYGSSSIIEGFDSLVFASTFFKEYGSEVVWIVKLFLLLCLLSAFWFIIAKKKYTGRLFTATLLLFMLIAGLLIEGELFQANYPKLRTALFYIPIFGTLIYHLFVEIVNEYRIPNRYYVPFIFVIVIPIMYNFVLSTNISYTTTWRYDSHTKNAMAVILKSTQDSVHKMTISNHWLFEPTINYYIDTWQLNLTPADRKGVNLSSDFIYRYKSRDKLNGYSRLRYYEDIDAELLIAK